MKLKILVIAFLAISVSSAANADSLFSSRVVSSGPLVSDLKARFEVGDIITVIVREKVKASTKSDTRTKKESDVAAQAIAAQNQFLINDGPGGLNILNEAELPNWQVEAENEARATGSTRRSSELELTITCTVMQVLKNDTLYIEGQKRVTVNREDTNIALSGIIRARDVSAANTIPSSQIANATIQMRGQGPLWNNQRRGLFTKVLDWFSPF